MTDYTTPPPPPPPPGPPGGFPPPPPGGSFPPPPPGGNYPPPGGFPPPGGGGGGRVQNGFGIGALVTGILSILLCCCPCVGPVLGVAGAVLGFLGMKKADQGLATNKQLALAGLITGVIGIVLGIVVTIYFFANGADPEYWRQIQQQN